MGGVAVVALVAPAVANAVQSPSGRAFELVSAASDGVAEVVRVPGMAEDGNAVAYMSLAGLPDAASNIFAATSLARRSATGWTSTDASIPAARPALGLMYGTPVDFSTDFTRLLFNTGAPADPQDQDGLESDLYRYDPDTGSVDWLSHRDILPDVVGGTDTTVLGATRDLSRVVFYRYNESLVSGAPANGIYVADDEGLRLASVLPDGVTPVANAALAGTEATRGLNESNFDGAARVPHGGMHAVSDDGTRVYFTDGAPNSSPLYLRDGDTTVAVSASQRVGDAHALRIGIFIAASHDGGTAYFDSPDQLTDDAAPGGGIYRYDVTSGELSLLVSAQGNPVGLFDFVQRGMAIASDDMTHIYFLASRALVPGPPDGNRNQNLYVWSASEGTRFIATLPDNGIDTVRRVSRDGRYAVFTSNASIDGAPNDHHAALYEYDDATQAVTCISCRPDGSPSQGDASLDAQPPELVAPQYTVTTNITDDGRVFFTTTDHLLPQDVGAGADVYLYDHGALSLITPGTGDSDAYLAGNTDDGRDVFFMTRERLLPSDPNPGGLDLYDARVGGGFPEPPAPSRPCEGDGCQAPASARPELPSAGSTTANGRGNVRAATRPSSTPKRSVRLARLTPAQRARLERTGQALLAVHVTGGGIVTLRARARTKVHRVLGTGRRSVRAKGAVIAHVTLRLTASARRTLARHRRMRVTITAALKGGPRASAITVDLKKAHR